MSAGVGQLVVSPVRMEGGRSAMSDALQPFEARPHGVLVRGRRGGDGPPMLLLHGTAGSWRNFQPWLPALRPRGHLLIPDLPGFGESPAPRLRPRLRTWARLLHALGATLDVRPRVVVGLGFGASVALAYLATAPASAPPLSHLVLYTPAYYPGAIRPAFRFGVPVVTAGPVFALLHAVLASRAGRNWFIARFVSAPDQPAEDAALLREAMARVSLPVLRGLAHDIVRADFRPLLRALPTPTLVLAGRTDPFVEAAAMERLATLMPRAEVAMQDLGHGWTPEAVAEHHRLLAAFLDGPAVLGHAP